MNTRAARTVLALAVAAGTAGCMGDDRESPPRWSVREAQSSVSEVRGLKVRAVECRGLEAGRGDGRAVRFTRFACVAGARNPWERFDSVAVHFELRPRRPYDGSPGGYELRNVRFTGGPGIP